MKIKTTLSTKINVDERELKYIYRLTEKNIKNKVYYEFGDNKTEAAAAAYWEKAKREGGKKK